MFNSVNPLGTWTYHNHEMKIEENAKGVNFLTVDSELGKDKVHIFVAKNIFSKIKYFFLSHFSDKWSEVELLPEGNLASKKPIRVLLDLEALDRNIDVEIRNIFNDVIYEKMSKLKFKLSKGTDNFDHD